ncbi:PREDICTED: vesicle transport through interaction with t-SNAREs homolog 1B [Nanorana parkeri]|uniref:vesicle transport through interaction with t-SNAREs homolog 1B n=1 Tax=Nanorana parkeri TaxID=125878 RepID=UPI000854FBD2|nr:PREDICTED: vesicle transport through interaction with t-SNAREs homolog 1B [Nanorana parkeri]
MSSEHFEAIHDVFRVRYDHLQEIPEKLKNRHGEERKKILHDFEENHLEANEMLIQMEKELKSAPPSFQREMISKLHVYRRALAKLQTETKNMSTGLTYENSKKGFAHVEDQNNAFRSQRTLLLDSSKSLNSGTDSIARSHHLAAETDAIGHDIVEVLGGQREQLERTKDRLINTGENLSKSRKILRTISRKLVTNKLLLSIIVTLEFAILAGLVYYKFFRKT